MSKYTNIVSKIHQLESIAENLDTYKSHFETERYSWFTSEYLAKKLSGAQEYFDSREELQREVSILAIDFRTKRETMEDFTRGTIDILRGYLHFTPNEQLEQTAFVKKVDTYERGQRALLGIEQFFVSGSEQSEFIEFKALSTALKVALNAYNDEKQHYSQLKSKLEQEKQDFLQREDDLDDLYHDVINAIEGALHEDREILLKLMPWRKKKDSDGADEVEKAGAEADDGENS
jgi:hypothetical protein